MNHMQNGMNLIYILYASKNKKEKSLKVKYKQLKSKYDALKKTRINILEI